MHLKTIKLAGFKSFVDPTIVPLQGQLTAILGPNGCGKSNVVDALRWVIGESSAKQLRGESLTDVIFNGTSTRKPVGQASVELVFDNSLGRFGGAYSQYTEIVIRREITREGQSQFYLNASRCRRRDVMDLFLGTGLGPSSYAIIEQGVISQLIDGKPQEVGAYIGEAAGISKYTERRRETENRIRHTRENLDRLTDLRSEIEKQLEHLKRQASAAERFKNLKQEQRLLKSQLHAMHCRALDEALLTYQKQLYEHTNALEATIAGHRQADLEIEKHRILQSETNEIATGIQARYYELGSKIARDEQQVQYIQQQSRQLSSDFASMETSYHEAEQHLSEDQSQIELLSTELESLVPQLEKTSEMAGQFAAQLQEAEKQKLHWQSQWDEFQTQASQAQRKADMEQTRAYHLGQKVQAISQRIQQLETQHQTLNPLDFPEAIEKLSAQSGALNQQLELLQNELTALNTQIQMQREANQRMQSQRDVLNQKLHQHLSQKASLEALQKVALGKHDKEINQWLAQQGWSEKPRLISEIDVEAGWETAVETVLAPYLEAICTKNLEDLEIAAQVTQGRLSLFYTQSNFQSKSHNTFNASKASTLSSKIHAQWPLVDLLQGIYVVEEISQALELIKTLDVGESVITKTGIWLGPSWLRVSKVQDESSGVLQRKQALHELDKLLQEQQLQLEDVENLFKEGQSALFSFEEMRDSKQREFRELSSKYNEVNAQFREKQVHLEQLRQREATLIQELQDQKQQLLQTEIEGEAARVASNEIRVGQTEFEARRVALLQSKELCDQAYSNIRQQTDSHKKQGDEYQVRISSTQNQLHYLRQNILRTEKQLDQIKERREALLTRQQEIQSPLPTLQTELQRLLEERLEVEKSLTEVRAKITHIEYQFKELEKQRTQLEQEGQAIRDASEKIRLLQTTAKAHKDNHLEQILSLHHTLEVLLEEMPQEGNIDTWQQQLDQIESRIQRLGAINLAAIDEYNALLERKTYLDDQDKDLTEALTTLEDAIRKIDRESRARLRETFDKANANFKALFTKMFEGGNAELEWSSDDVLEAGVLIRAQPPGKRNTLLHLLSGGEKALTAIALVFALFQLNPAPFCVLDEVDAPLDEANVRRFCRLVKSMSEAVQFVFISHNKVSMEMASQLIGVTMQEAGVSRLVSVDMEQALALVVD